MSFCLGTPKLGIPKFPKLGLLQLWRPITSCTDLQLGWGVKKSCSPCQKLSKDMQHATFTRVNWGDYRLLVVRSQIANLTPNPSFSHNLWFKYPNGSCKPILDINVPRSFQWYKELFNPMKFDLYDLPLKIWKSIKNPTPKVGAHLVVWGFIPSHFPTLPRAWNVTPKLHSWPTPLQALCLGYKPKVRVVNPRLGLDPISAH
jgi:hypothetical protein